MIKEYPWLEKPWLFLQNAAAQHRLSHAYLFQSRQGLAVERLVKTFAMGLLCEERGINACKNCRNCELSGLDTNPDLIIIKPEEKSNILSVAMIRELIGFFSSRPLVSDRKVAIIAEAETMNLNAANAVLKILEEPPSDAVLLLTSRRTALLPKTFLSRCQQIFIPNPPRVQVLKWMEENIPEKTISMLRQSVWGSPLELLAQLTTETPNSTILDEVVADITSISQGDRDIISLSERYLNEDAVTLLDTMEILCHLMASLKYCEIPEKLFISDQKKLNLQSLSNKLELSNVFELNDYIIETKKRCLASSGIKSGDIVETLFYRWLGLFDERVKLKRR